MRDPRRWAFAIVCLLVAACDGSKGNTTSTGTGGSGGGGGAGCPLDAVARQRVEAVAQPAVASPGWIIQSTHGHGMFAGRGFGVVVPFTTMAMLYSASLVEACTEAKTFDPYCEPSENPGSTLERCSQLSCEAAGSLTADVWVSGLPADVPAEPPPGNVTMKVVEHATHFLETGTDGVDLSWEGVVDVTLPDGAPITWTVAGTGSVGEGASPTAAIEDTLDGVADQPVSISVTIAEGEPSGQIGYAGEALANIDHDGITWLGACAP